MFSHLDTIPACDRQTDGHRTTANTFLTQRRTGNKKLGYRFFVRTAIDWNHLSEEIDSAPSVETYRAHPAETSRSGKFPLKFLGPNRDPDQRQNRTGL